MRLNFTKMQGLGNDFMVVNAIEQPVRLSSAQIRTLSDRHFGIGFDQLLLVEAPTSSEADFRYRIFNADGLEVSQCGNGARCFARYVVDHGLINKNELRIETSSGIIIPRLLGNGLIEVDMGKPRFLPQDIPFLSDHEQVKATYQLDVDGLEYEISALSVGNPHAVLFVKDIGLAPVLILGPKIEAHGRFPEKVNVGFVQVIDRQEIAIRVFERGVGETLACGTGACAAVAAAVIRQLTEREVLVHTRGGDMVIHWRSDDSSIVMQGPAQVVYEGVIDLKDD